MKDIFKKHGHEIELAAQEWGIREGQRLFGVDEMFVHVQKTGKEIPVLRGYYVDTGYKTLTMAYFNVKENKGRITITRVKAYQMNEHNKATGYKWPIKILRTNGFISKHVKPVDPLYEVLLCRKIILPFQSTMKVKDWLALPFEEKGNMEAVAIY